MRISTANALDRSIDVIQQRQQALQGSQERLTSGKRVARASDDPTAAARAERALAQQARTEANQRGLEASRNAMAQAESALADAGNLMQRVRELTVQAGNASYADPQRRSLAQEIRGLRDQLLQVANRSDGAGAYLFGGQGAAAPPFLDATGGVQFAGTAGEAQVGSSEPLPLSVDGDLTWLRSPSGNGVFVTSAAATNSAGAWVDGGRVVDPSTAFNATGSLPATVTFGTSPTGATIYSVTRFDGTAAITDAAYVSGQSIAFDGIELAVSGTPASGDTFGVDPSTRDLSLFDALDRLATGLETTGRSGAQITQVVQEGLRDVDATLGTLISVRARLGGTLNRTDVIESRLAETRLAAQSERSAAEDLDMVEAVSEFQIRQTSYDAALKSYSMVQRLSLFEYIR